MDLSRFSFYSVLYWCHPPLRRLTMQISSARADLFCTYYENWINVYKKGAIREVTLNKYLMTLKWLQKLIPGLKTCELTRIAYQQLLNDYAENHERQTTMDFHHQLKGAILDAVDDGLIPRDPTRKAIIKGKTPALKKRSISINLSCTVCSLLGVWKVNSIGTISFCSLRKRECAFLKPLLSLPETLTSHIN